MIDFGIPENKKVRVIIDTDAKNEVDDQFAIVQALLTPSFDIRGLISAHFGTEKSAHSEQDSYEEIQRLLTWMDMTGQIPVYHGAEHAMRKAHEPVKSEGAELIVKEAMRKDTRTLYIAFLGPLTDMAAAIFMEPEILKKNIVIIWIGGRDYPAGGWEYNLQNDIKAAQYVFGSSAPLWQIPRNVYRMMPVSFAELYCKVREQGAIGRYLAENVIQFNNEDVSRPTEYRILGDSPAVGVILYPDCGEWEMRTAPEISSDMTYRYTESHGQIRVYKNMNSRFILEDLYAKLALFCKQV